MKHLVVEKLQKYGRLDSPLGYASPAEFDRNAVLAGEHQLYYTHPGTISFRNLSLIGDLTIIMAYLFNMENNNKTRLATTDIAKIMGVGAALGTAGFFIGLLFNIPSAITTPITGGVVGVIVGAIVSQNTLKIKSQK